jgi:hypothetical protein
MVPARPAKAAAAIAAMAVLGTGCANLQPGLGQTRLALDEALGEIQITQARIVRLGRLAFCGQPLDELWGTALSRLMPAQRVAYIEAIVLACWNEPNALRIGQGRQ